MEELKKMTDVFFQNTEGKWLKNQIDLKAAQKKLPFIEARTLSQPNALVCEMMLDIFEVLKQKHINFESSFVVTDVGDGKSIAAHHSGGCWSANVDGFEVSIRYGGTLDDAIMHVMSVVKLENEVKHKQTPQVVVYDYSHSVTVQNFDESVKAYAEPLSKKADIVYCNSLLARTPVADIPALIEELKKMGKYIFLTIPLIPSAGYVTLKASTLMKKAQEVDKVPDGAVVLEKNKDGDYLLPANISVLSKKQWQRLLGDGWTFHPSVDCTCVSAVNFTPSAEFLQHKKKIVELCGFADQIPFPSLIKSPVEKDPLLSARNAALQPIKHLMKLEALKSYPKSDFREKELQKSKAFLKALGINEDCKPENLPKNLVDKLLSWETKAKAFLQQEKVKQSLANQMVAEKFAEIIGM